MEWMPVRCGLLLLCLSQAAFGYEVVLDTLTCVKKGTAKGSDEIYLIVRQGGLDIDGFGRDATMSFNDGETEVLGDELNSEAEITVALYEYDEQGGDDYLGTATIRASGKGSYVFDSVADGRPCKYKLEWKPRRLTDGP